MVKTRSADFWLHDGSIVLGVEETLFKVHQTILTHHSEVFKDLFMLPQPPTSSSSSAFPPSASTLFSPVQKGEVENGNEKEIEKHGEEEEARDEDEMVEGCRVVVLPNDSAMDFRDLLGAIYIPSHFETLEPQCDLDDLLTFVSGILRLSTKYMIPMLRKRCIQLLGERIPMTWRDFDATHGGGEEKEKVKKKSARRATAESEGEGPAISPPVLNFPPPPQPGVWSTVLSVSANGQGAAISPPLSQPSQGLGHRSRHHHDSAHPRRGSSSHQHKSNSKPPTPSFPVPKTSSVMRLISLAQDFNVPMLLPYAYYLLARTSSPRRYLSSTPSSLSFYYKTLILVGRTHLHDAQLALSHAFLITFTPAPNCPHPDICGKSRGPLVEWAMLSANGKGPTPLKKWDRWDKLAVCRECVACCKDKHERGRQECWDRLPGFFELDSWKTLSKTQDA